MAEAKPPMGLDPNMGAREFVLEVDAEALEKMRKVGHVKIPLLGESFAIACDEGDGWVETIPHHRHWSTSAPPSRSDC